MDRNSTNTTFSSPTTTNITVTIIGPPPPSPAPARSIDLSPLKFILGLIAVIAIPALLYSIFFAVPCPSASSRRRNRRRRDNSDEIPDTAVESAADSGEADSGIKFRKETHSKEIGSECPVCLSVFADGEEIRRLSACKHAFHSSCIDMWLSSHDNCPICRASVPGKRSGGNNTGTTGNNNRRVSAHNRDDDLHQGLPDASGLV